MIEIIITDVKNHHANQLEVILQRCFPDDFIEDFHGLSFSCHPYSETFQILVVLEEGLCVGGAVISKSVIFNEFSSSIYTDFAQKTQNSGHRNFCYFGIQESKRGKGYGKSLMKRLVNNGTSYWLSCQNHLSDFYINHGFEIALKSNGSNNNILIYG